MRIEDAKGGAAVRARTAGIGARRAVIANRAFKATGLEPALLPRAAIGVGETAGGHAYIARARTGAPLTAFAIRIGKTVLIFTAGEENSLFTDAARSARAISIGAALLFSIVTMALWFYAAPGRIA
jgi:hypothetical protein